MISVVNCFPAKAQNPAYETLERCAALPSPPPDTFDGVLITVGDDAARAFRQGIATTYVLAFGGGHFLSAGAVSPDGRHYAVPYGIISTIMAGDVRHVVQELRIFTTETVPRIIRRLPWRASFPVGTRFTTEGNLPAVRWLDAARLQFISGTLSEGHTPVTVDITGSGDPVPYEAQLAESPSPDGTRGFRLDAGLFSLMDPRTGELVRDDLPRAYAGLRQIAWSPESERFAMTGVDAEGRVALVLYDRDGAAIETVVRLPPEQVLWNLRWSPAGAHLAFSAFDPQTLANRLHVVDLSAKTVTDTCLPLLADVDGRQLSALAWSPDGTRIAVMTRQAAPAAQVQIYDVEARTRYNLTAAAGRLLGWYP